MNREQMIKLLDGGYTPEYISLLKWLELRRQVMNGCLINRDDIDSLTCAMCKEYNTFKDDCECCTMSKHFIFCDFQTSIWKRINNIVLTEKPVPLHLLTQMVNQLLFLVAVYGVHVTTRNEP